MLSNQNLIYIYVIPVQKFLNLTNIKKLFYRFIKKYFVKYYFNRVETNIDSNFENFKYEKNKYERNTNQQILFENLNGTVPTDLLN